MASMLALRKALSPNLLQKLRPAAAVAPTSVRSFNTNALCDYDDGSDGVDRRSSGNYVTRRRGSDYPSFFGGVIDPFSPPRSLSQIFNLMDQMTENPFLAASRRRDIEVKEDDDALRLRVGMPGLGKEDVNVSIEQNTLVIRGEVEKGSKEEEGEEREMRYSSRIELPAEAYRVDEIKAEMKNGVLRVTVPKVKEEERSKIQPCGLLDMEEKCITVSESLPKISASILEEAQLWVTGEDSPQDLGELPTKVDQDSEKETFLTRTNVEGMAMIRFDAMQRANSTLEDFCRSYFMFHGMDVNSPQCLFRFLPVLSFTESYIYQMDIFNEEILHLSLPSACPDRNSEISNDACAWGNKWEGDMEVFRTDPLGPLLALLGRLGLLTERIKAELRCGAEYWALERKLCHALNSKKEITVEEVMRAINLKSFDYRVLNLLLYQLREQPVNDTHMEFLSISEFLVEVSDDLFDYEDDVVENNFNILRMFVGLYGAPMAPSMLAKRITEAECKYECLSKALDPDLSLSYWRRCEEATKEGGKASGYSLGTWNIPPVIADEESYRARSFGSCTTSSPPN